MYSMTYQLQSVENDDPPMAPSPSAFHHEASEPLTLEESAYEAKRILRDFIVRVGYRPPHTPHNAKLRAEVTSQIVSWDADLSQAFIEGLSDTSCSIAECAYPDLSFEHQLLIALYTAYVVYIDDLGERDLSILEGFGQRLVARQDLGDPVLERMVLQFQDMYALYPRLSADSMVAATLEVMMGMYMEFTTQDMAVAPSAVRYPSYMRLKTGIGSTYALFNFAKGWRDPADSFHMQLVPEIEHFTDAINDILSYYKEALEGETYNYINFRASAEKKNPLVVLRELCEETLDTIRRVTDLTSSDQQLSKIHRTYLMGYIEFHFKAKRYRLEDLGMGF